MGEYVDIGGHPTWVERIGSGAETVLMLHGGLSNGDDLLTTIGPALAAKYRIIAFDRRGHGRTADTDAAFHYDDMASETIGVLERVVGGPAHLIGWSDGGIISLLVGGRRPDLVRRMVLIGTNYHFDGLRDLDAGVPDSFTDIIRQGYAARSPDGGDHFPVVLDKTMAMFASEPTMTVADLAEITPPALVVVGDDDLIELDHTASLYESLPGAQLAIIPATSHAVALEKPAQVAALILEFLAATATPPTFMPSRRAGS